MTPVRKRLFCMAGGGILSVPVLAVLLWMIAPCFVQDPLPEIRRRFPPVRTWLDRNGRILWHERQKDAPWRFPVPQNKIAPVAVRTILAAEDAGFFRHGGVDHAAVCRAFLQNVWNRRVISGASTISMQLAAMKLPPGKHTLFRKLHQGVLARKLERCHGKEEILNEYLNRIPFGGRIAGIEAAALYYFGRHASELNAAESALLCGIPQKPNRFRPDRHRAAARERQRILLRILTNRKILTGAEARRILLQEPLRFRDFRIPAEFEQYSDPGELRTVFRRIRTETFPVRTSIDQTLQERVREILRTHTEKHPHVRDAACVLLDNRTKELLVRVSTLDFQRPGDGQADAASSVRTAGSTLKTFLYAMAIDGGFITAGTRLSDTPFRRGSYAPGNADGRYRGSVTAAEALPLSLNVPAIRLAETLGEERILQTFLSLRLISADRVLRKPGLTLALGTIGHTLEDLTRAYGVFTSGGKLQEISPLAFCSGKILSSEIFSPGTCELISRMLRASPLPGCPLPAAWKTGTSTGNRDAWCFAFTKDLTAGVWFGNKNGEASPALTGIGIAAPAAGEILETASRLFPDPGTLPAEHHLEERVLCAVSGLTPGPFCRRFESSAAVRGIPLQRCVECGSTGTGKRIFRLQSPQSGIIRLLPGQGKSIRLPLRSEGGTKVRYFLNGTLLPAGTKEITLESGRRYSLRAVSEDPPETRESVITVLPAEQE